ncbi:hypothetical protein [Amycolatopsis kentuckyensis]|uniref:hypothetical protein n=1 Tax=Amycolatopsis kentuckyensis TaxID=218823 RepID=UPI003569978D
MTARKAVSARDMNGQKVVNLGDGTAATDAVTKQQLDANSTTDRSRANHTGTQLAATISDLATAVRLNALDQLAAPTGDLSIANHKLVNVTNPTAAQDAATKAYVDSSLGAISGGLAFKGAARVASSANVSVAAAPATVDGVAPTNGDVVLLTAQTTGSEGGAWVWNGAGAAMTRPANWDTTAEAVPGSIWVVQQGTYDNQLAILSNDTFTLGVTTPTFVFINPGAAVGDAGITATCPAVTAGTTWTINHGFNTRGVGIVVYRATSPYDEIDAYITHDTVNAISITPDIALANGEFVAAMRKFA